MNEQEQEKKEKMEIEVKEIDKNLMIMIKASLFVSLVLLIYGLILGVF